MRAGVGSVRLLVKVAFCLLLVFASVTFSSIAARAAASTSIPFRSFYRIIDDGAHGWVFVSGGPGTDKLAVFDESGAVVTTITLQGPSGMAIVGSELYVAEADAPQIAVVDTSQDPPAVTRTIDVGTFTQPRDLTYVAGRLWFIGHEGLGWVRPEGSGISNKPFWLAGSDLRFADNLSGEDRLIIFTSSCGTIVDFYTATAPPKLIRSTWNYADGVCFVGQMAVRPGNATLIVPGALEVSLTDDSVTRSYDGASDHTAVAVTTAHGGLIAGGDGHGYLTDIWVWRFGESTPVFSLDFADPHEEVQVGGVAWSSDGDHIFAVTEHDNGLWLEVIDPTGLPNLRYPSLTIDAPADAPAGQPVDVQIHLDGGASNRDVSLYSQPVGEAKTLVAQGTVDADGILDVSLVLPWTTTLVASFAGDEDWGMADTAATVNARSSTSIHVKGKRTGVHGRYVLFAGSRLTIVATVAPAIGGGDADVVIEELDGTTWTVTSQLGGQYSDAGTFALNGIGLAPGTYRIRAISPTTDRYLRSRSPWFYCKLGGG
jgi:hypothetical protein